MAGHERRQTIELCLAESNDADDETSCDANNNSGETKPWGSARESTLIRENSLARDEDKTSATNSSAENTRPDHSAIQLKQRQQTSGQSLTNLRSARRSESNASESDGWHLLDADEQSISSASSLSSSQEKLNATGGPAQVGLKTKRNLAPKTMTKPGTATARKCNNNNYEDDQDVTTTSSKYLDVDPLDRAGLSPALVYACTAIYSLLPLASLLAFSTLVYLLFTKYWYITVFYYSYLLFDAKTCNQGGRRWPSVYKARFWSHLAAYFPIKLRYSQSFKLNPNENYILNYHPHGISAFGCVTAFATDGLNFSSLFPGIRSLFMVHETSFLVPIMREAFAFRGDCSVNSKSFDYILGKRWQAADGAGGAPSSTSKQMAGARGNLLALCGGGLAEADLSDMDTLKIVCATRKGFVKKSLIHGAHLIPCIAFGENSVFKKINFKPGSLLYRLEKTWYQLFKFKHPIYFGRSLLFGSKGLGPVPYKRPITVVMGDPIHVERVEQPSQEQIDQLHSKYIERLKSMYEDNREQLCNKYDTQLQLV